MIKRRLLSAVLSVFLVFAVACSRNKDTQIALSPAKPMGKVIVIGFDGLDPGLVRNWVAEGKLPTFAKVINQGAFGDLWSVLPFSSAPAWTSAMTGVNPGKHSIYGFLKKVEGKTGEEAVFSSSMDRGFAPVWEVIGSYGLRSCIINIPLTSPSDSLNVIMIACFTHASE
ncbi:MAG: alkaline phosphatase family protein [bacterium]